MPRKQNDKEINKEENNILVYYHNKCSKRYDVGFSIWMVMKRVNMLRFKNTTINIFTYSHITMEKIT